MIKAKEVIFKAASTLLFNYKHPRYSYPLYFFAKTYQKFYENYENCDMETNGEYFFIDHVLKELDPKVMFDIGANEGDYSQLLVERFPKAELHCFEPDQRAFSLLEKRLANRKKNAHLNKLALSDKAGKAKFYLNEKDHTLNSLFDMNRIGYAYESRVVEVEVATVDGYCQKNKVKDIDFLKIDVEGNELAVMHGAAEAFKAGTIKMLQFEYGNSSIASRTYLKDYFDFFLANGYSLYKIMPRGLIKLNYSPFDEGVSYVNLVAVNNKITINPTFLLKRRASSI